MEKISAACAMTWSIAFEKGMRSKEPDHMEEAILQIGNSLRQWSRDPIPSIVEYNMFCLLPGEDLLFLNTILFRLVNAFCSGNQRTKFIITKVFLSLSSHGCLKNKKGYGILSRDYVHNRKELIQRVKVFLHGEDVTSRSLALILFGCWADFSSDNVDIRYMIFSGLQSPNDFEVKASLYATGCLSEVSSDFALPIIHMIMNIVISPKTSTHIRLAAFRVFSKSGFSSIVANKVLKMGIKMVKDSTDECFVRSMLIVLTKITAKSPHLLLEKVVDFLFSFLTEVSSNLKAVVLNCVHILLRRVRGSYVPCISRAHMVGVLINIIENPELFPTLQLTSLQLIHEILVHHLSDIHEIFSTTLESLLKIFTDTVRYPETSVKILVFESIIEISGKCVKGYDSQCATLPYSRIINACFDRVTHLVELVAETETEFHSLLRLLLRLLRQNLESTVFVVDRVIVLTEFVINLHKKDGERAMMVLHSIYKFASSISEVIIGNGSPSDGVLQKLISLANHVGLCNSLDLYTRVLFSLLSHHCTLSIGQTDCLAEREAVIVERLKEFDLFHRDRWAEYKVGRYASVQGAWSTAAFVFSRLENGVKFNSNSNPYRMWLSILAQFAQIEMDAKLVLSKTDIGIILTVPVDTIFQCWIGDFVELSERVGGIYNTILSALEALIVSSNGLFYFQKWFLKVRFSILTTVLRIFMDLNFIPSNHGVHPLSELSSRFSMLAKELDLMQMLFVEMGEGSSNAISEIALSCSMLAFITGFTHSVAGFAKAYGNSGVFMGSVEDLHARLGNTDHEICVNLRRFMKVPGDFSMKESSVLQKTHIMRSGFEYGYVFRVCEYAVAEFGLLQSMGDDETLRGEKLLGAFRILFKVVKMWLHIPFTIPRHFFLIRSCTGSEIYTYSENRQNSDEMYVITYGSHLSLNVCVQLKNMPNNVLSRLTKLYCSFFCTTSLLVHDSSSGFRDLEIDLMIDMNKKLRTYATEICDREAHLRENMGGIGGGGAASSFISLRPNGLGQGFSTCVLDTSNFPEGSYHIKWLSCCVDDQGILYSLLPLNDAPSFSVKKKSPG